MSPRDPRGDRGTAPQLLIATCCSVTHAVGLRPLLAPLLLSSDRGLLRSLPKRLLGLDLSSQGLFLGDPAQETHQSPSIHSKGDGFHQVSFKLQECRCIALVDTVWGAVNEGDRATATHQGLETLPQRDCPASPQSRFASAKGQQPSSWSYPDVSQRSSRLGGM